MKFLRNIIFCSFKKFLFLCTAKSGTILKKQTLKHLRRCSYLKILPHAHTSLHSENFPAKIRCARKSSE